MNRAQFLLTVVQRKKTKAGKDAVFIAYDGKVKGIGLQGTNSYETPIVNLLHNYQNANCELYASYEPTEMCLGLAWQRQIQRIVFLDKNLAAKEVTPSDSNIHTITNLSDNDTFSLVHRINGSNWYAKKNTVETFPTTLQGHVTWNSGFDSNETELTHSARNLFNIYADCNNTYSARVSDNNEQNALARIHNGIPVQNGACNTDQNKKDYLWMKIAFALAGAALPNNRGQQTPSGHNVAAIMVDNADQIIGWGLNMGNLNGCLHAETSMVLAYLRGNAKSSLPDGARIYSTLAPCHMCAGFITTVGKNIPVVIGHIDPRIKNSALDLTKNGCTQKVTSILPIVSKPIVEIPELRSYALNMGNPKVVAPKSFPTLQNAPNAHPKLAFPKDAHPLSTPFSAWMYDMQKRSGKVPNTSDWLKDHHTDFGGNRGVTTFLNQSAGPAALFSYSLASLKDLLDAGVADPGETVILQRGIALITKLKQNGLIKQY